MNDSQIDKLAQAVLYEGFILYPYRPSVKNAHRWTFGGLYPREFCEAQQSVESPFMQLECLIVGDAETRVEITIRFLRLIDRKIGRFQKPLSEWPENGEPAFEPVDCLAVDDRQFHSWQEAAEHKWSLGTFALSDLLRASRRESLSFPDTRHCEPIADPAGRFVGLIERTQHAIDGSAEITCQQVAEGCFRLTLRAANETSSPSATSIDRNEASLRSFAAAHAVVAVAGGELVSQIDPPEPWRELAAENQNVGLWPVLVGEPPDRTTLLASPIILYDFPQIAPESPMGLFDSTEIDEILTLRIMTLSEAEKCQMRAVDPRGRDLLERVESLGAEDLLQLHGATRDVAQPRNS